MTLLIRDIVKRSQRLLGALVTGDDPSADELSDELLSYTAMQRSLFGTVIGPKLSPFTAPTTPGQAENGGLYMIPASLYTLTAPTNPRSGARFGAVDPNLNFATNNCTIARNGRLLEGAASNLTLSTNGANRQWFFDADTGNWVREADPASVDVSPPFPDRLISHLPAMLAVWIAAEFGSEIRPDVVAMGQLGMQAFARVYARRGRNQTDAPIGVQIQETARG